VPACTICAAPSPEVTAAAAIDTGTAAYEPLKASHVAMAVPATLAPARQKLKS